MVKRISELPTGSTLTGSEPLPVVQSGTTVKSTIQAILTFVLSNLTKSSVGLSNVDNTSDVNKPISTATQTALNAKQDTLISGTNIKTINSTSLLGTGNIAISGSVADGDKGDITVSGSGATWTIDNAAVTYGKIQDTSAGNVVIARSGATAGSVGEVAIGASQLLGRGSTGDVAAITLGANLTMTGTTLSAAGGGSGELSDGDKGDITVSGAGTVWTIDNSAVTYAKIQNVSATDKLLGRVTTGAGTIEEVTCTAAGRALLDDTDNAAQRTTLGLGTAATMTGPSGAIVGTTDTQSLSNKTLTAPTVTNYTETRHTFSAGASFTIDLSNGTIFRCPTNANATITLPTPVNGKSFVVEIEYGGAHTVTFSGGGTFRWIGGTAPTPTSVSGKIDFYTFSNDSTHTFGRDGGRNA